MKKILTARKNINPETYLNKMLAFTSEKGKFYIARYQDEVTFETATKLDDSYLIQEFAMDWNQDSLASVVKKFNDVVAKIENNDLGSEFVGYYGEQVINRADRLRKLIELDAPQMIIKNEKVYLMESIAIYMFGKSHKNHDKFFLL